MSYNKTGHQMEKSNPLGTDNIVGMFLDDEEYIEHFREIEAFVKKLSESLDPDEDIKFFPKRDNRRHLISVAVDGGSQELFPFFSELSSSIIRVSASSKDFKGKIEPFIHPIKYSKFSKKFHKLKRDDYDEKARQEIAALINRLLHEEMSAVFTHPKVAFFSDVTGITVEDLGQTFGRDLQTFTNSIRDLLEWVYIVNLVEKFSDFQILIMKDGRLEQHGVEDTFRTKLLTYLENREAYITGVLKSNAVFREGIAYWVLSNWVDRQTEPFYFLAPDELMDHVYAFRKQWDPEESKSFMLGYRYFGRLYGETFNPMQSMIAFDIPKYFHEDYQKVEEIATTLFRHKSLLYGGSIQTISEAHSKASIASSIVKMVEKEIEKKSGVRLPQILGV